MGAGLRFKVVRIRVRVNTKIRLRVRVSVSYQHVFKNCTEMCNARRETG